jgi:hypothetical protein
MEKRLNRLGFIILIRRIPYRLVQKCFGSGP